MEEKKYSEEELREGYERLVKDYISLMYHMKDSMIFLRKLGTYDGIMKNCDIFESIILIFFQVLTIILVCTW